MFGKKIFILLLFSFILVSFFYLKFFKKVNSNDIKSIKTYTENDILKNEYTDLKKPEVLKIEPETKNTNETVEPQIKDYVKIKIPFICQAPSGNWDELHEEACEEASLLMIKYYREKRELILSKEAEEDIKSISEYVKIEFSPEKKDLNIEELKILAEDHLNLKEVRILSNPEIKDLEKELDRGNLIIAPMAGRELKNPFFKNPGPLYHMLVISGYDKNRKVLFTQDPGTKRGRDYEYTYETIEKSIHDFPGRKEDILSGEKKVLVFLFN